MWTCGKHTASKERMYEAAKTCYFRAYLRTHYKTEFNEVFIIKEENEVNVADIDYYHRANPCYCSVHSESLTKFRLFG